LSTKFTKEELKNPDQMTQTLRKGFAWTTNHSKMVVVAVVVFLVVGIGASIMQMVNEKKETAVQEKYFSAEKAYTDKKRSFDEAARAELMASQAKDKKNIPPVDASKKATGDLQKDYGSVITNFEALISEAPSSKAAQMSALNLSDIYLQYKKNDEALATLQKVESGLSKKDMLTALAWMQMGNAVANKGDCKGAVEKWQKISDTKALAFAHDEAKLRMGLCYESLNDLAKAEQLYTEVAKKEDVNTSDFVASKEAEKYLRLLKAKKNL
jgi:hypothetical protein